MKVAITRAFVKLRHALLAHEGLARSVLRSCSLSRLPPENSCGLSANRVYRICTMFRVWIDRAVSAFAMGWGFRVFESASTLMHGKMAFPAALGFTMGFGLVLGGLGLVIGHPWSRSLILFSGWGGCVAELIGILFIYQFFARQSIPMPFPHQAAARIFCYVLPALWIHFRPKQQGVNPVQA